mgnify:CR=1 FL=1
MNRWVKKGFSLLLSAAMLAAGMPAAADTANAQEKEAADSAYTPAFMDEESVKLFPDSV